jgi:ubiquitin C-terminal hydrolase
LVLEQRKLAFAPNNLFFNIQRYFTNPDINVPFELYLGEKYFEKAESANYNLEGFARNINNMHYMSYIKKNGVWFLCDDNHVKPISEAEAQDAAKTAYVLQYKKI